MTAAEAIPRDRALWLQLVAIAGRPDADDLIEVRWRRPTGGMGQRFYPANQVAAVVGPVLKLAERTDVYLGCAPRRRGEWERPGGAEAIERAWMLWVDCDSPEAARALRAFEPRPTMVVASGTEGHVHGYWALREPLGSREVEDANRRLIGHLGADRAAFDIARVLRAAGTLNHKSSPPRPVECVSASVDGPLGLAADVLAGVPLLEPLAEPARPARAVGAGDELLSIAASVYVPLLTGRDVGRDGKVSCPFHEERTPSLHAYSDPAKGWACFGCEAPPGKRYLGGTIIDFGARLYGIEPRGTGFREVRRRLAADLLGRSA